MAKKKHKKKNTSQKNKPIPNDQIEGRLNNKKIKWRKIRKGQYLCERRNGDEILFFANGVIESNYFNEKGLETLVKICLMEQELTLKDLSINMTPKTNLKLAYYMTEEALQAKHKIIDFCYKNNIPYQAHDAIITVLRKKESMPYKTFDKIFIFNAITGITKDEKERILLPKGPDTLISVLKGETDQYAYAPKTEGEANIRADFRTSPEYIETAKLVRARDNYKCRCCGRKILNIKPDIDQEALEVHHPYSYTHYQEKRMDMDYMFSLCPDCHELFDDLSSDNFNKIIEKIIETHETKKEI